MIQKEGRIEIVKFFIRLSEIIFTAMIVAPVAAYLLGKRVTVADLGLTVSSGLLASLTLFLVAVKLIKRWK